MSSNKTVALGSCPSCQSGNPYTNIVCNVCGARLPWADAVSSVGAQSSTPSTPVSTVPFIPAVPPVTASPVHTWVTQAQTNSPQQTPLQDPQPIHIRVSARILDWPFQCPCCGDLPDTSQTVTHTHKSGQRFVRITNENWSVPYCLQCAKHLEIFNAAHRLYVEANDLTSTAKNPPVSSAVPLGGCAIFSMWYMACLFAGAVTGHFIASIFNGLLAAGVLTIGTHFFMSTQRAAQLTEAQAKAQLQANELIAQCNAVEDEAREIMKIYCCWPGISVHYCGAHGTVHTFEFFNPEYAEAFIRLNASKIVQ